MKAAIFTPYLDTLGGGERYVLSVAKVLLDHGWTVLLQGDSGTLKKAESRFSLDLANIQATNDIKRGEGCDLCFWLSDGSIPTLRARKNILHFQRPFYKVDGKSLINRMKLFRIHKVVVNSHFTKFWIDKEFPIVSEVLYPPVDIKKFKIRKKEKNIIYVGRFSQLEQSKRQDVLIEVFKRLHDNFDKTWKLQLVGGSDVGKDNFLKSLKESASGYPVEIIENAPFNTLKEIFGKATLFWSAAGFEVNKEKSPEKLEHFGMTVVEAMAAGCIPIVYKAGGHEEIIKDGENGFLWESKTDLIKKTIILLKNQSKMKDITAAAKKSSLNFSYENFEKKLLTLL